MKDFIISYGEDDLVQLCKFYPSLHLQLMSFGFFICIFGLFIRLPMLKPYHGQTKQWGLGFLGAFHFKWGLKTKVVRFPWDRP
jgi:hypothetical protein